MDGLSARQNLVVIGATNRPTLDLALTPGRFDKVIYLDLPAKRKRFELFKFYSQVGIEDRINWDYFAKQTAGLRAHISAAMNSSLLKVISENYFSDYWPAKKKSRTNTFQFVPLIQDRKS
jgi:ATP-dependent 26S proteasome regulatory subunit